ncbi:MAG TPA: glycoside hydrolase family 95 protein [Candidatus Sulfopaludibacter sp.]|nr:glycoside hydrolase family 95 protein [Candidatus Sulfopaludibacter sp.]
MNSLFSTCLARFIIVVVGLLGLPLLAADDQSSLSETTVWSDAPARNFTESSPMGNGRLGAMMFGGVAEERIVLNESSVWSGSRQDADRPDAYQYLPDIRRLLLAGKNVEAEALVNAHFTCKGPGSGGAQYGCYQVLGNLHLRFEGDTNAPVENYRRVLDLGKAVTRMEYQRGGVTLRREMFVSAPDQVMVLRLTADQSGRISFDARLDRPERFETVADKSNELLMTGQLDNGTDGKGVKYAARVRILNQGGDVSTTGNDLHVSKANEVVVLVTAATDYRGFAGRQTKDPLAASLKDMNRAADKSYEALREAHIADYQKYFNRVSLHLEPADLNEASLPTPKRIEWAKVNGGDPSLAALYFNFGRYLLISSSRPGGLPPNLQGIWAEEIHTPWNGDWHLDVNVEMNYWPAEICNLSDLTQPLFALTASLQSPGEQTARDYYNSRGWVAHVITNPWGFTSPGESASWGASTSGSGWLCQHLWDHWLFTRDKKFLRWAYPIMKGSAQFYSDMLIEEPTHHWLVIAPANSPENHFELPDGQQAAISLGSTFQSEITHYLFTACIESSKILGIDEGFRNKLIAERARLSPIQIGPDGRVMEWLEPYKEPEPHHRHVSHLWGLYPGDEISPYTTPALALAARKTLEVRGDDGVGWSLAFKAALWARLGDGNRTWLLVQKALAPAYGLDIRYDGGGGVYPNMFDACPPFQIDGNFGTTAAIAEMLLQSENGFIRLLPALPDSWKNGSVTGLCARGGFEVGMMWQDGKLISAKIRSLKGERASVSYRGRTIALKIKRGESVTLNGSLAAVHTP